MSVGIFFAELGLRVVFAPCFFALPSAVPKIDKMPKFWYVSKRYVFMACFFTEARKRKAKSSKKHQTESGGNVLAKVSSSAVIGIDAFLVEVEIDISQGLPSYTTVGLAETAVKESKERVKSAVKNSGYEFPEDRITVNLAPAWVKKEGTGFDLPLAPRHPLRVVFDPPERTSELPRHGRAFPGRPGQASQRFASHGYRRQRGGLPGNRRSLRKPKRGRRRPGPSGYRGKKTSPRWWIFSGGAARQHRTGNLPKPPASSPTIAPTRSIFPK